MPPSEVLLDAAVHGAILRHAADSMPFEMAGALGGHLDGGRPVVDRWLPLGLLQRGTADFRADAVAFARAEATLRAEDRRWHGFVHSHPGAATEPSKRDRAELWRDCVQLIVGAGGEMRAFWLDGGSLCELGLRIVAMQQGT
jgi:proteasome lid subunit RPN8/RPN11